MALDRARERICVTVTQIRLVLHIGHVSVMKRKTLKDLLAWKERKGRADFDPAILSHLPTSQAPLFVAEKGARGFANW